MLWSTTIYTCTTPVVIGTFPGDPCRLINVVGPITRLVMAVESTPAQLSPCLWSCQTHNGDTLRDIRPVCFTSGLSSTTSGSCLARYGGETDRQTDRQTANTKMPSVAVLKRWVCCCAVFLIGRITGHVRPSACPSVPYRQHYFSGCGVTLMMYIGATLP